LNQFGWAHITSGGTIANIEALLGSEEAVKYLPLSMKQVAKELDLHFEVETANKK